MARPKPSEERSARSLPAGGTGLSQARVSLRAAPGRQPGLLGVCCIITQTRPATDLLSALPLAAFGCLCAFGLLPDDCTHACAYVAFSASAIGLSLKNILVLLIYLCSSPHELRVHCFAWGSGLNRGLLRLWVFCDPDPLTLKFGVTGFPHLLGFNLSLCIVYVLLLTFIICIRSHSHLSNFLKICESSFVLVWPDSCLMAH